MLDVARVLGGVSLVAGVVVVVVVVPPEEPRAHGAARLEIGARRLQIRVAEVLGVERYLGFRLNDHVIVLCWLLLLFVGRLKEEEAFV